MQIPCEKRRPFFSRKDSERRQRAMSVPFSFDSQFLWPIFPDARPLVHNSHRCKVADPMHGLHPAARTLCYTVTTEIQFGGIGGLSPGGPLSRRKRPGPRGTTHHVPNHYGRTMQCTTAHHGQNKRHFRNLVNKG